MDTSGCIRNCHGVRAGSNGRHALRPFRAQPQKNDSRASPTRPRQHPSFSRLRRNYPPSEASNPPWPFSRPGAYLPYIHLFSIFFRRNWLSFRSLKTTPESVVTGYRKPLSSKAALMSPRLLGLSKKPSLLSSRIRPDALSRLLSAPGAAVLARSALFRLASPAEES